MQRRIGGSVIAIASRSTFKIGDEEIINSGGLDVMVIKHNSDGITNTCVAWYCLSFIRKL